MKPSDVSKATSDQQALPARLTRGRGGSQSRTPELEAALGARIRAARIAARMSQGDLGAVVGISFQQVQKYENGKDRVAASTLQGFAAALGVNPGSFFDGDMPVPVGSIADVKAAIRAADAFQHIRDPRVLKQLIALARELATPPTAVDQPAPEPEGAP
jgi:transcriptional regulator with XRE-family HTH domain